MRARFAEVRLHSATMANLAVYCAFTEPGDTIAVLAEHAGGHTSHQVEGVAGVRGLRVAHLPYDVSAWDVDLDSLGAWLDRVRPRLVVVGASLMLFPHRLGAIRVLADGVGAVVSYDASHVAGLIAGGRFQQPLEEGAHVMTFSTYKSFGGPAGGAVVSNDPDVAERVSRAAYPGLTANYDAGRLAPLAARAVQHLRNGSRYADSCLDNAQVLATSLAATGQDVVAADWGHTASHHVAVDVASYGGGSAAAARLASAGIFSSAIGLPRQAPGEVAAALRLGTQELTSRGFSGDAVAAVGSLVSDVLNMRVQPQMAAQQACRLRRQAGH